MTHFVVDPVEGYEDEVLAEYAALPLACASGFSLMMDILEENEPGIRYRCGLIDDRFELYAISLPACAKRAMIVSVDRKVSSSPRHVHGILPVSGHTCDQGAAIAIGQLGLVNPSWEKKS